MVTRISLILSSFSVRRFDELTLSIRFGCVKRKWNNGTEKKWVVAPLVRLFNEKIRCKILALFMRLKALFWFSSESIWISSAVQSETDWTWILAPSLEWSHSLKPKNFDLNYYFKPYILVVIRKNREIQLTFQTFTTEEEIKKVLVFPKV